MAHALKSVFVISFVLMQISLGFAAENRKPMLDAWYQALSPVDREIISVLLSDEAEIELKDYEIVQTKQQFINSLDSWEDAIEDGSIRFKIDGNFYRYQSVKVIVCYQFPSNELMTSEIFKFSDRSIIKSQQETISEDCSDF